MTAVTDGAGLAIDGAMSALMVGQASAVTLRPGGRLARAEGLCDRAFVAPAAWQRLKLFADRTAPATPESRALGAGGGDDSAG